MHVVFEGCRPEDVGQAQYELAAAHVGARTPDADGVELVISNCFEASVQRRAQDEHEKAGFTRERVFGSAGAKTLRQADGRPAIILDAGHVASGEAARTAAHEAYHAALIQRAEQVSDIRIRHGFRDPSRMHALAGLAGIASEEYRVERALYDEGFPADPPYRDHVQGWLNPLLTVIVDGLVEPEPGRFAEDCFAPSYTAFNTVGALFAYVAAADLATDGTVAPDRAGSLWEVLVGDHYDQLRSALARVPPAHKESNRDTVDQMVLDAVVPVMEDWFAAVGFVLREDGDALAIDVPPKTASDLWLLRQHVAK